MYFKLFASKYDHISLQTRAEAEDQREPDEKREGTEEHNWEIDAYLMAGKQRPGVRPRGNHCIIDNRMDTESKHCPGAPIKKDARANAQPL